MAYCLNPRCPAPETPGNGEICQHCQTPLRLQDRYCGLRLLGQGGFGRTILGEDQGKPSKPRCVIKVFAPQSQGDLQQAAELFQQEAVRLDDLGHHDQIPALLGYATQNGYEYIIQEFIPGRNLGQVVREEGPLTEAQVRGVLGSLLPVLQFVHDHQVIHRDLKPANIIQRQDGSLVLVDFGAAKYATATALGKTGTVIGSAEYAAPEQVQGQARFASDIYGLGVTCLFLLTGMSPFELFSTLEDEWIWRDYLVDNPVSEELGAILDQMIVRAMRKRYGSAKVLLEVLAPAVIQNPPLDLQAVVVEPLNLDVEVEVALTEQERDRGCKKVIMALDQRLLVIIPAGVRRGQKLRLTGEGKRDPNSAAVGDVFLVLVDTPPMVQPAQPALQVPLLQPFTFPTAQIKHFQKTRQVEKKGLFRTQQVTETYTDCQITKIQGQGQQIVLQLPGGVTLEAVAISGGSFMMGAPKREENSENYERPQHQVTLPPFLMGKYPVTQAQYRAIMGQDSSLRIDELDPSCFKGDNRPVERVSWDQARAFCEALSKHLQEQGLALVAQLPTEAAWEYACRAGTMTPFAFGETITPELVNCNGNYPYGGAPKGESRNATTPVGSFPANAWGLYDMHGNVWEWCLDGWIDSYGHKINAMNKDELTTLPYSDEYRVLRGGSWNCDARDCRSANRVRGRRNYSNDYRGFRLLLSSRTS